MDKAPKLLRLLTGGVWLYFGPGCKWFGLGTDHQRLVGRILGDEYAWELAVLIGAGEALMAIWAFSGLAPRLALLSQIVAILAMNLIEWFVVRDLLVMGSGNFLLALAYCAFLSAFASRSPIAKNKTRSEA